MKNNTHMEISIVDHYQYSKVLEVELTKTGKDKNLFIVWLEDDEIFCKEFQGQFGRYDYVEEFGFEIL